MHVSLQGTCMTYFIGHHQDEPQYHVRTPPWGQPSLDNTSAPKLPHCITISCHQQAAPVYCPHSTLASTILGQHFSDKTTTKAIKIKIKLHPSPPSVDSLDVEDELRFSFRLALSHDLGVESLSAWPRCLGVTFWPWLLGGTSRLEAESFLPTRLEVGVGLLRGVSLRELGRLLDLVDLLLLLLCAFGVSVHRHMHKHYDKALWDTLCKHCSICHFTRHRDSTDPQCRNN